MNHMKGTFAPIKRSLYKNFIAEKEGYVPDEVSRFKVISMEIFAGLYICFLSFYLFQHSIKYGQLTTLIAVGSFSVELMLSVIIVSPLFILIKYMIVPYVIALIVEGDVKKAASDYDKNRNFRRRQTKMGMRGRMNSLAKSINTGVNRTGRAMSGKSVGRLSIDNGDGTTRPNHARFSLSSSGSTSGSLEEGRRKSRGGLTTKQVEMIDMRLKEGRDEIEGEVRAMSTGSSALATNPMRMLLASGEGGESDGEGNAILDEDRWWMHEIATSDWEKERKKHEHDTDGEDIVQNWIMHYTEEDVPYFEHGPSRRVTFTVPDGFMEDACDDEWEEAVDEGSGSPYFVNARNGRSTWDNPKVGKERSRSCSGEGGKGRNSFSVSKKSRGNSGNGAHHHHPHANNNQKKLGDRPLWKEYKDEGSGVKYFMNRITRAVTWTDYR